MPEHLRAPVVTGLSALLSGRADAEAMQRVAELGTLSVLSSGVAPPNPTPRGALRRAQEPRAPLAPAAISERITRTRTTVLGAVLNDF
jgi:hypothetical protein